MLKTVKETSNKTIKKVNSIKNLIDEKPFLSVKIKQLNFTAKS